MANKFVTVSSLSGTSRNTKRLKIVQIIVKTHSHCPHLEQNLSTKIEAIESLQLGLTSHSGPQQSRASLLKNLILRVRLIIENIEYVFFFCQEKNKVKKKLSPCALITIHAVGHFFHCTMTQTPIPKL